MLINKKKKKETDMTMTMWKHKKEDGRLQAKEGAATEKPNLPIPWSWTSSFQNCEKINICV
jgi:hypothetical protein